jgi:hypothetical protein
MLIYRTAVQTICKERRRFSRLIWDQLKVAEKIHRRMSIRKQTFFSFLSVLITRKTIRV